MKTAAAITLPLAIFLVLFSGQSAGANAPQAPGADAESSRKQDPSTWDGTVGEDNRIPEFGVVVNSGEGKIQFCVWKNRLRLYFLDEEDLLMEPEVGLVTARLAIRGRRNQFIRLLDRGNFMESSDVIRPPHTYFVTLTIHRDGQENEVHSFQFHQPVYGF